MAQPIEDTIMKNIMELFRGDAIKFFGIDTQIVASARNELTHMPIQRKTDDWLWEVEDGSYLHFEFQSDYDKQDLARFMLSDAMLHHKTGKPIRTIVVYSAGIKDTLTTLDAGAIQYHVSLLHVNFGRRPNLRRYQSKGGRRHTAHQTGFDVSSVSTHDAGQCR